MADTKINIVSPKGEVRSVNESQVAGFTKSGWTPSASAPTATTPSNLTGIDKVAYDYAHQPIPNVVNAPDLASTQDFKTAPTSNVDTTGNFMAGLTAGQTQAQKDAKIAQDAETARLKASMDAYSNAQMAQGVNPDQTAYDTAKQDYTNALDQNTGMGSAYNDLLNTPEYKASQKQLADLNILSAQQTASFNQGMLNTENKVIPMQFITGQQASMQKQYAITAGATASMQQALQGNITAAQQTAKQTVEMEFADRQQNVDNKKAILELNYDSLTASEKKRADALTYALDKEQTRIDEAKAEKMSIQQAMLGYITAGGTDSTVMDKISKAETYTDALNILGKHYPTTAGGDYQYIPGTENQPGGVFNKTTGQFTASASGEAPANFPDFENWLGSVGSGNETQGYETEVTYFTDGRATHGGYDIGGQIGDPITAPVSGTIVSTQTGKGSTGWGNTFVLQDDAGNKWRLAHFDSLSVQEGDKITAGQQVGTMGSTGKSTGPHLHVEVKNSDGQLIDPKGFATTTSSSVSPQTQAIIDNPSLFDDLTPTAKGKIIGELQANDYNTSNLGVKGLSDVAINTVAQSQKALDDLAELESLIRGNEDKLGPIKGLAKWNPWSESRKLQADVDRVRQTVGKALEGGVLRKEDEEKYKKILATLTDTPSTALYKITALVGSIQRDIENYKSLQLSSGRSIDVGAALEKNSATSGTVDYRSKYNY